MSSLGNGVILLMISGSENIFGGGGRFGKHHIALIYAARVLNTTPLQWPEVHCNNNADLTGAGALVASTRRRAPAPQPCKCYHEPPTVNEGPVASQAEGDMSLFSKKSRLGRERRKTFTKNLKGDCLGLVFVLSGSEFEDQDCQDRPTKIGWRSCLNEFA